MTALCIGWWYLYVFVIGKVKWFLIYRQTFQVPKMEVLTYISCM